MSEARLKTRLSGLQDELRAIEKIDPTRYFRQHVSGGLALIAAAMTLFALAIWRDAQSNDLKILVFLLLVASTWEFLQAYRFFNGRLEEDLRERIGKIEGKLADVRSGRRSISRSRN